jgi:pyridoxamine 5'-phosphate oxidase
MTLPRPLAMFEEWYAAAEAAGMPEPESVVLATATPDGRPSARVVLFRGLSEGGFRFFTNYDSRKGRELELNPRAALCFYWKALYRQVRIEGLVEKLAPEESDAYFRARPHGHQLGAWSSPQSQAIEGRDVLLERYGVYAAQWKEGEVPRPAHWGGYRVVPEVLEFWEGKPDRLHHREVHRRNDAGWERVILAP